MARHCVLPLAPAIQLGRCRQEAHGRYASASSDLANRGLILSNFAGLPFYQDKLHEETVYKRFGEILTKVSRV